VPGPPALSAPAAALVSEPTGIAALGSRICWRYL
jgi:hypothetical protein